ncbi:MAG: Cof-type HAD-IIB family hydrolase [Phocaeicola sp.]
MIKAIFFDIDGTLVSFKTHQIPSSTSAALKELRQQGIKLFISTGRPWNLINNLGDLEFDGYITVNGGHCFTAQLEDIFKRPIPNEDIEHLIAYEKENPTPFVAVYDNRLVINQVDERVMEIGNLIKIPTPHIAPLEEARHKEVLQLMGYFTSDEENNLFKEILPNCEPMRWHPLFTDIVAKGNSKSNGIDQVIRYYNLKLEECMAFGDGGNDIPMLKHVPHSVAMGNASDEVKAAAKYVTTSVDEDGIATALKRFGLIDNSTSSNVLSSI